MSHPTQKHVIFSDVLNVCHFQKAAFMKHLPLFLVLWYRVEQINANG